jgi:protein-disulfide isomerase
MTNGDSPRVRLSAPVTALDHVMGPPDARVTLVQYADFECLHCGRAFPILRELRESMGQALRFVYRHFPLSGHPHAQAAAEAAEAAAAQGKFWAMHDKLFTFQLALDEEALETYAEEIGLDLARFRDDVRTHVHAERVRRDVESGRASGVTGTPTFFIDGARYGDGRDLDALSAALLTAAR